MSVRMSKEKLEQFLAWLSSDSMVTTLPGDGGRAQDVFAFLRTPLSASVEAVFGGRFSGESKWQFPLVEKLDLVGYYQKEKDIFWHCFRNKESIKIVFSKQKKNKLIIEYHFFGNLKNKY